ncbi:MAG: WG repeat-containing protein, partial [Chitinophagaceae bacterium]|nr:WG repeat-containing protein [Chitinophagaceae bacterium]
FSIEAKQGYNFQENIAVINRTGVYELMDTKGNPYKELTDIEVVKFPKEGLLGVRKDKKWGFIDKTGKQVVPFLYEDCDSYVGNYAKVKQDGKWGIIDKTGKVIIAPKYDNIVPNEEGIFIYYQDSFYGIIDKNGKIISSPNYYPLTPFYKGVAIGKEKKSFVIIHSPLAK